MNELKKHLNLFPARIRKALNAFDAWDRIREIRLRCELPLSLTSYDGNIFLSETGQPSYFDRAMRCTACEIRELVSSFCSGSVYRYLDTLKDGFLVDESGWRLGLCPDRSQRFSHLPERFEGANLRLPRSIPNAAAELISYFSSRALSSTLLLSPPGDGKTTMLRSLACSLSRGDGKRALRVAVIDERQELFPACFREELGLCDVLSGYSKAEGLEIATRIFSPEIIVCDEIGSAEDVNAILSHCHGGSLFFASAHAESRHPEALRPSVKRLIDEGVFQTIAFLERIPSPRFSAKLHITSLR